MSREQEDVCEEVRRILRLYPGAIGGAEHAMSPQDMDRLSREFVMLAVEQLAEEERDIVAVSGVEYAPDMHLFRKEDDLGFDPEQDVEPDDAVPTLVVELKATQYAEPPETGKAAFPKVKWHGCAIYEEKQATVVLCLYIPKGITKATPVTLNHIMFWISDSLGWPPPTEHREPPPANKKDERQVDARLCSGETRVKKGEIVRTKAGRMYLGKDLGKVLRNRVTYDQQGQERGPLPPYRERKRDFNSADSARAQAAIDAFERQVLQPMGARLLPPEGGGEGGATDARIEYPEGKKPKDTDKSIENVQFKNASTIWNGHGWKVHMARRNGSTRNTVIKNKGETAKFFHYKPYKKGENDRYIFVELIGNSVYQCWAPTEQDLIGKEGETPYIADENGVGGVENLTLHDEATAFNATVNDTWPPRTPDWMDKLGVARPYLEAVRVAADRRVERLKARREIVDDDEETSLWIRNRKLAKFDAALAEAEAEVALLHGTNPFETPLTSKTISVYLCVCDPWQKTPDSPLKQS